MFGCTSPHCACCLALGLLHSDCACSSTPRYPLGSPHQDTHSDLPVLNSAMRCIPYGVQALSAFRVLLEQLYLHRCSSSRTTEGVRVDATSQFYGVSYHNHTARQLYA